MMKDLEIKIDSSFWRASSIKLEDYSDVDLKEMHICFDGEKGGNGACFSVSDAKTIRDWIDEFLAKYTS